MIPLIVLVLSRKLLSFVPPPTQNPHSNGDPKFNRSTSKHGEEFLGAERASGDCYGFLLPVFFSLAAARGTQKPAELFAVLATPAKKESTSCAVIVLCTLRTNRPRPCSP